MSLKGCRACEKLSPPCPPNSHQASSSLQLYTCPLGGLQKWTCVCVRVWHRLAQFALPHSAEKTSLLHRAEKMSLLHRAEKASLLHRAEKMSLLYRAA